MIFPFFISGLASLDHSLFNKDMKPAGHAHRFFAHLIDAFIIAFIWFILVVIFSIYLGLRYADQMATISENPNLFNDLSLSDPSGLVFFAMIITLIMILLFTTVCHIYFILMESRSGQTVGKRMMRLKVVSEDGSPITRRQAVIRDFAKLYFEMMFAIPLLYIFFDKKHRRLGDKWAKTLVIDIRSQ